MAKPTKIPDQRRGVKHDEGKPRMSLLLSDFALAFECLGRVSSIGAEKYAPGDWRHVENGEERYTSAMIRHLLKDMQGEAFDQDIAENQGEDVLHLALVAWNAVAVLELRLAASQQEEAAAA